MYRPTTSTTFSAKFGSFETLNVFMRCGFRPAPFQMFCTAVRLMPTAFAILRALQCVALSGLSVAVFLITASFVSADSGGLRPGRVLSRSNPSTPSSMKRSCHRQTHGFDLPVRRIMAFVPSPSAVASTMSARHTALLELLRSVLISISLARLAGLR